MAKKSAPAPPPLTAISLIEFVNRFVDSITTQEQRFTWFVGAGCSISSGIKAAGGLVEQWLQELWGYQDLPQSKYDDWLKKTFPAFDAKRPAAHYAQVFERRHPAPAERQREIERICEGGEPSYGYATFAQLLSDSKVGQRCNTVLTTNFDDLIADALYVYGDRRSRPQVITHEALARYVRIASPRPTIVKLHGDAHLDPKNLSPETKRIQADVAKQLHPLLLNSAIVFVGYGGNDESIAHFFDECPTAQLAPQIYWVGKHDPAPNFLKWLGDRGALRVDHTDFDQLMHLLRGKLYIDLPQKERWDRAFKAFFDRYEQFQKELMDVPEGKEKAALRQASQEVGKSLPNEWDYYAKTFSGETPDEKEAAFNQGLSTYPNSALLAGMYAAFLQTVRKDMDAAGTFYKRAIEADPKHADNLGNYALFLETVRKDMDAAETFYKRAIEADPKDADNLSNYALFLQTVRKDMDAAETFYKRAIEADPKHANGLGNYAQLALSQGRVGEGLELVERAVTTGPEPGLIAEVEFYRLAHDRNGRGAAMKALKKAVLESGRSLGWDFSSNIERARIDGFEPIDLLEDLAKVISEDAPVSILDKYEEWRNA